MVCSVYIVLVANKFHNDNQCSKHDCCTNLLIFLLLFLLFQTQAYKCPRAKSPSMNDTIVGHHLTHDETVLLEIINSGKMPIQAFVAFNGKILLFSVKLQQNFL